MGLFQGMYNMRMYGTPGFSGYNGGFHQAAITPNAYEQYNQQFNTVQQVKTSLSNHKLVFRILILI
jgi:hypothetical protein